MNRILCVSVVALTLFGNTTGWSDEVFPGLGEKGQLQKLEFEASNVATLVGRNARRLAHNILHLNFIGGIRNLKRDNPKNKHNDGWDHHKRPPSP